METVLKLGGVLEGVEEELVEELHAFLPVFLREVVSIHFLEFAEICVEVLTGHQFVHYYFFKLVVLDLQPQVVFPLHT